MHQESWSANPQPPSLSTWIQVTMLEYADADPGFYKGGNMALHGFLAEGSNRSFIPRCKAVLTTNNYFQFFDFCGFEMDGEGLYTPKPTQSHAWYVYEYEQIYNSGVYTSRKTLEFWNKCWRMSNSAFFLSSAVPKTRPVAKAYCNKTVSVTFTPEAPPGIGDRTEYNVSIGLFKGETPAYLQTLTLPATVSLLLLLDTVRH